MSDNTEEGINIYLNAMNQLELDYPHVTFVYMTGHLDGTGDDGNLNIRNNQIRDYCTANNKILFDFADIESYDPDGNYFLNLAANDECNYWFDGVQHNWADEWCAANPGECKSCSCAHSRCLNCQLKGRAFWHMMARIAERMACEGDFDNDTDVDGSNLAVFAADFGRTDCLPENPCQGDFDGDNDVDGSDLAVFAADFGRTDCPVYPRIEEYSNSGCLPGSAIDSSGDQYPDWCDDPDEIEIFVEGYVIHVTHRNVIYNCCTDDIEVSMSVEGNLLRLWEKEILTHPCYCLCCYDLKTSIVGFLPGVYALEYCWEAYETEPECYTDEIVIP